jgi:hypothetical protein
LEIFSARLHAGNAIRDFSLDPLERRTSSPLYVGDPVRHNSPPHLKLTGARLLLFRHNPTLHSKLIVRDAHAQKRKNEIRCFVEESPRDSGEFALGQSTSFLDVHRLGVIAFRGGLAPWG